LVLTATDGPVSGIRMEMDGSAGVEIPAVLQDGESLVYDGGPTADLYSSRWRLLGTVLMDPDAFTLSPGRHEVGFDARPGGGEGAYLKVELRVRGVGEPVTPMRAAGESEKGARR
jgi:hypothetical protein